MDMLYVNCSCNFTAKRKRMECRYTCIGLLFVHLVHDQSGNKMTFIYFNNDLLMKMNHLSAALCFRITF